MKEQSFPTVVWTWDIDADGNGCMRPVRAYRAIAERVFVYGEQYRLEPREERSGKTHRHYFAALKDIFENLPEGNNRWPSVEHFRAWLLVKAGYADEKNYILSNPADAMDFALSLRSDFPYSIIECSGNVVRHYKPKSQSTTSMDAKDFQKSKEAVLRMAEEIVGVTREDMKNRGHIA